MQVAPQNVMALNFDVLIHTMSFQDRAAVGRLMRTCQSLYSAGVLHLLKGPMKIESVEQFQSLCEFLARDPPKRASSVRELEVVSMAPVTGEQNNSVLGDTIVWFFNQTTSLETLRILCSTFIDLDSRISTAISSVTTLRELYLDIHNYNHVFTVHTMQAPLTRVKLMLNDTYEDFLDPVALLEPMKDSLESLSVFALTFVTRQHVYPRIQRHNICAFEDIDFAVITHCFPHLYSV